MMADESAMSNERRSVESVLPLSSRQPESLVESVRIVFVDLEPVTDFRKRHRSRSSMGYSKSACLDTYCLVGDREVVRPESWRREEDGVWTVVNGAATGLTIRL